MGTTLYVEKDTDLMRSTFIAVGLAALLYRLDEAGSGMDVQIRDMGSAYTLEATRHGQTVEPQDLLDVVGRREMLPPLLPAILKPLSAGEHKRLEEGETLDTIQRKYLPREFIGDVIDYGAEKAKADARFAKSKGEPRQEGDTPQRHPDFPLWAHLCSYFGKGSAMRIGYPLMLHVWHSHTGLQAQSLLALILECYGVFPPPVPQAQETWAESIKPAYPDFALFQWDGSQTDVSALSIVSPTTAQGSFTLTGARPLNTDTPNTFWLEIYLAFAGYMTVGMPYRSGGDVLMYYPLPRDIRFSRLQHVLGEFRQKDYARDLYDYSNRMPRAKLDALNQLDFYRAMVEHYRFNPPARRRIDAISAVVGYYYKDISTQIPFDETTFALPRWLPLDAETAALEQAEALLKAHRAPIAALRGEYTGELEVLDHYRRFITLGDADDWVEFAIAYGVHRFQKLEDSPWLPWLHINIVEGTLMNQSHKDYRPILRNEGFRNLAAAIRHCTVQLRYWKDVKKAQTAFKVRHGLGDDLRRRAHNADEFIEDLSAFMHDYLRESSSVQANTGEMRPFITENDLYQVIELVDNYGSRVVASLLVAAGYASDYERPSE